MTTCFPPITSTARGGSLFFGQWADVPIPAYVPLSVLANDFFMQNFVPNGVGVFRGDYRAAFGYRTGYFTDATGLCYLEAARNSALQMANERNRRRAAQGQAALSQAEADKWYNGFTGYVGYEGDFSLSLRQLLMDDMMAADPSVVYEPLKSLDGILPYTPARLAQVELADTYNLLRHTEENALDVLAQSQDAQTVARISTTQTVTDPIGRLVTGAIVQQTIGNQAIDTVLPSAQGVGPEGTGVNSQLPVVPPGTPPPGGPGTPPAEAPATGGGGWLAIALPIALLLLPKK